MKYNLATHDGACMTFQPFFRKEKFILADS